MSEYSKLVEYYGIPARDPDQERPKLARPPLVRTLRPRRRQPGDRARRLAYVDDLFPWLLSGFRYHEAYAIWELRPDTLFFSLWDLTDPFPVPVHRLTDFPAIATEAGITDVYGVFLYFLESLCGLRPKDRPPHPFEGPDLSKAFRASGVRLHGSIYPGGGFSQTPECIERVLRLSTHLETMFSYVPEVIEQVPGVTEVEQAFTSPSYYGPTSGRWAQGKPLIVLFAAQAAPRKGIDVTLAAFRKLPADSFHLHVVGPHLHRRNELPESSATFHGWLPPDGLRELHTQAHVFVSPVTVEKADDYVGALAGMVDGFPTQAAADAMSSGCLLVSANPGHDHRVLTPGVHYVEIEPDVEVLRSTLIEIAGDLSGAQQVADAGGAQVRTSMDIRRGTATKLRHMGLLDGTVDAG